MYRGSDLTLFDRFSTYNGRQPIDLSHFELDEQELEELTRIGPHHSASTLPAFYHLYLFGVSRRMTDIGCSGVLVYVLG
jgi:hypothetical protein